LLNAGRGSRASRDPGTAAVLKEMADTRFSYLPLLPLRASATPLKLAPEYEEWLTAAALLHEIGSYINRAGRHRHTYYLIAHSEIFGYTTQQREIVAAIARFIGKSKPAPDHRVIRVLPELDRHFVVRAVALLRLALAIDQGRAGAVQNFRVRIQPAEVKVTLESKRGTGDLEMWAVEKESNYFRAVFGRDLSVELA